VKNSISTPLKFLLIGLFLIIGHLAQSQNFVKKYINGIINDTSDISKPQFLVYPTVAFAPETSWEFGISSLLVYYAKQDTANRLSEINGFTFFTLENQYGKDRWFFLGRIRFQSFPLFYHGIGNDTPKDYIARVDANQIFIKERVLRKIKRDLFIGLEIDFQRLSSVGFVPAEGNNNLEELPLGNQGSTNLGFGIGFVHDNRHNVLNVRKGLFSELALLHYNQAWGSTYNFTSVVSDNRIYRPIGENNVFAAHVLGQFNSGNVPFNQLALMGGESIMRGYYYGRYRDRNQLAAQLEYRFLPIPFGFTDRLGAAVFAGAGKVFPEIKSFDLSNIVVSGGAGIRFLLFPKKDIYTRFDVAFTNEGPGYYLFIGEAF